MMWAMSILTGREIAAAGLVDWSLLGAGLQTRLLTRDFATGLRLVARIGVAAETADHHPDLDLPLQPVPPCPLRLVQRAVGVLDE